MKQPHNADQAAREVFGGKAGSCGILRDDEGSLIFFGFGVKRPIMYLRVEIDGHIFDQHTFPFQLFMRRGKADRKPWAVLSDDQYATLAVSGESSAKIKCLALIDPRSHSEMLHATSEPQIPIALGAYFAGEVGGVVVLKEDQDFCSLLLANGAIMIPENSIEQQDAMEMIL